MASDMNPYDIATQKGVAAHANISGKYFGTSPAVSNGKNALWRDGHVEWHELGIPTTEVESIVAVLTSFRSAGWAKGAYGEVSPFWFKPGNR